jgi:hypothetical protein
VWPHDAERRVHELALHHEDFRIEVHKELNNYNSAHAESWGKQIAEATRALLGRDPTELAPETAVHVVSSNTHSVSNCLSPWLGQRAEEILTWGRESEHPLLAEPWHDPRDLVYALGRDYLAANPGEAEARSSAERASCPSNGPRSRASACSSSTWDGSTGPPRILGFPTWLRPDPP